MNLLRIGAILLVFIGTSCNRKSGTATEETGILSENADVTLIRMAMDRKLSLITDSGTLGRTCFNFPDTLKQAFKTEKLVAQWFRFITMPKNLAYPYHLALKAEGHGLNRNLYHADQLRALSDRIRSHKWDTIGKIPYDSLAMFLLLSADGMMGLYHDLSCGRVDPSYTGSIDALPRRKCGNIQDLIQSDSAVLAVSRSFPDFFPYHALQTEFERLLYFPKDQLGSQLSFKTPLKPGDDPGSFHIRSIAKKLRMHGILQIHDTLILQKQNYDPELAEAVAEFQMSHGLEPTAVIDKSTLKLLNVTRSEMLEKLRAGLERWRWLGPVKESSRIWVNLAENRVYAYQEDTLEVNMKVCSGKSRDTQYYNRLELSKKDPKATVPDNLETPLMKARVSYVVANPTWHVPRNIMVKEMLPVLRKNPAYLPENNYKLYNWKGEELNPFSINWHEVSTQKWKYRIEQGPGPDNALGIVVIQFPNPYSIFMHDTPSKWAFDLDNRHVSHGCIRMENPLAMVEYLSSFNKKDNYDDILITMGREPVKDEKKIKKYREMLKDSTKAARLKPKPNAYFKTEIQVPVYIVYFTASIHPSGGFLYSHDGYDRDHRLVALLDEPVRKRTSPAYKLQTEQIFSP